MSENLIREIPMKGSPNWYNWDQRWLNRGKYTPSTSSGTVSTVVSENPSLKEGLKIRSDGIVYDSQAMKLYSVKPEVLEMLKYCNGSHPTRDVLERFGKEKLDAALKFGLLV